MTICQSFFQVYQLWIYENFDHQKQVEDDAMADEEWKETCMLQSTQRHLTLSSSHIRSRYSFVDTVIVEQGFSTCRYFTYEMIIFSPGIFETRVEIKNRVKTCNYFKMNLTLCPFVIKLSTKGSNVL